MTAQSPVLSKALLLTLIACRFDRLGTRLCNLAHGWELAERLERPFVCVWPIQLDQDGSAHPSELFDLQSSPRFDITETRPVERLRAAFDLGPLIAGGTHSIEEIRSAVRGHRELLFRRNDRAVLRDEPLGAWNETVRARMHGMHPSPAVRNAVEAVASRIECSICTAVHIRRGDIVERLRNEVPNKERLARWVDDFVSRFADMRAYARAITENVPEGPIAVFSDDPESARALAEWVADRHVYAGATDFETEFHGLTLHQRAFAELLLMARMRAIVGGGSNYWRFAALLGGASCYDARAYIDLAEMREEIGWLLGNAEASALIMRRLEASLAQIVRKYGAHRSPTEEPVS